MWESLGSHRSNSLIKMFEPILSCLPESFLKTSSEYHQLGTTSDVLARCGVF